MPRRIEQATVVGLGDGTPQLAERDNSGQVEQRPRYGCHRQATAMSHVQVAGVVDPNCGQ